VQARKIIYKSKLYCVQILSKNSITKPVTRYQHFHTVCNSRGGYRIVYAVTGSKATSGTRLQPQPSNCQKLPNTAVRHPHRLLNSCWYRGVVKMYLEREGHHADPNLPKATSVGQDAQPWVSNRDSFRTERCAYRYTRWLEQNSVIAGSLRKTWWSCEVPTAARNGSPGLPPHNLTVLAPHPLGRRPRFLHPPSKTDTRPNNT